jgi:hypothetical protein
MVSIRGNPIRLSTWRATGLPTTINVAHESLWSFHEMRSIQLRPQSAATRPAAPNNDSVKAEQEYGRAGALSLIAVAHYHVVAAALAGMRGTLVTLLKHRPGNRRTSAVRGN